MNFRIEILTEMNEFKIIENFYTKIIAHKKVRLCGQARNGDTEKQIQMIISYETSILSSLYNKNQNHVSTFQFYFKKIEDELNINPIFITSEKHKHLNMNTLVLYCI